MDRGASGGVLSSANDNEVGGLHARSAPDVRAADLQEESTKRVENGAESPTHRFVGADEDGGSQRTSQRAERAIRQSELASGAISRGGS